MTTAEAWSLDPEINSVFAGENAGAYVVRAIARGLSSAHEMDDLLARNVLIDASLSDPHRPVDVEAAVTAMERLLDDDAVREGLFRSQRHPDLGSSSF